MNLLVIDTETTGLDARKNDLVQVSGFIEIGLERLEEFDFYMRPNEGQEINKEALNCNNLTLDQVKGFPDPKLQLAKLFEKLLNHLPKGEKYHLMGYNVKFDEQFFYWSSRRSGFADLYYKIIDPRSIDVMSLSLAYFAKTNTNLENYKQGTVAKGLNIELDEKSLHNSMYDVEICYKIYNKIMNK